MVFVCLVGCLVGCLFGCLVVWLFGCLVVWLFGCLVVCLVAWLLGCLVAWLLGCLVAWLLGCLVAWLLGCLVVVVVVFVLSFRQDVFVHKRLELIVHYRYRVTWESQLPATPVPPSPRALTGVSARGLQNIDSRNNFER